MVSQAALKRSRQISKLDVKTWIDRMCIGLRKPSDSSCGCLTIVCLVFWPRAVFADDVHGLFFYRTRHRFSCLDRPPPSVNTAPTKSARPRFNKEVETARCPNFSFDGCFLVSGVKYGSCLVRLLVRSLDARHEHRSPYLPPFAVCNSRNYI